MSAQNEAHDENGGGGGGEDSSREGVQKKDQRQIQVGSIEATPADAPVASAVLGTCQAHVTLQSCPSTRPQDSTRDQKVLVANIHPVANHLGLDDQRRRHQFSTSSFPVHRTLFSISPKHSRVNHESLGRGHRGLGWPAAKGQGDARLPPVRLSHSLLAPLINL